MNALVKGFCDYIPYHVVSEIGVKGRLSAFSECSYKDTGGVAASQSQRLFGFCLCRLLHVVSMLMWVSSWSSDLLRALISSRCTQVYLFVCMNPYNGLEYYSNY